MKKLRLYAASMILALNSFSINAEAQISDNNIEIFKEIEEDFDLPKCEATSDGVDNRIIGKIKVNPIDGKKRNFLKYNNNNYTYGGRLDYLFEKKRIFFKRQNSEKNN